MKLLVYVLLVCYACAFQVKVSTDIAPSTTGGYNPGEIIDIDEVWFKNFYESSIPVTEISLEDAKKMHFPAETAFVVKNSSVWNPLDEESECYDGWLDMLIRIGKKKRVQNALHKSYHSYWNFKDKSNREIGTDSCVPFLGKKNDVHLGYWNSLNGTYLTPMHADNSANMMWCKQGVKYVFLWHPDDHENLYMQNWNMNGSGSSRRSDYKDTNVDPKRFPNYWRARRYVVKMEANDILHMPYRWIHHVYTMPGSLCVNYWHLPKVYNEQYKTNVDEYTVAAYFTLPKVLNQNSVGQSDELSWMEEIVAMRMALANGQLVKIPNAFPNHEDFRLTGHKEWENDQKEINGYEWYDRTVCVECGKRFEKEISKYMTFWQNLLGTRLKPPSQFRGTKYKEGQYLENHNDNMGNRVLSIVYHMTDNWNSSCGGEFVWNGGIGTLEVAPSYNTLYLFVPRDSSDHRIKDVLCGERLGYSGWLTTDDPAYDFLTMVNMPLWQQRFTRGSMWDVTTDTGLK